MSEDAVQNAFKLLGRPIQPQAEFAEDLFRRLVQEAERARIAEAPAPARSRRLARFPLRSGPRPLRLILVGLAVLLVLGALAAAAYFGVKTWVSAGPRGVQFTSDFALVELAQGIPYSQMAIGPDGDELYGISVPYRPPDEKGIEAPDLERAAIVRTSGLHSNHAGTESVLEFRNLKDPALWDAGTDLSGIVFPQIFGLVRSSLSIGSEGSLAFVASVSTTTGYPAIFQRPPDSTSLLVREPGGRVQKVLTVRELIDAGLIREAATEKPLAFAVAFSARDRMWLLIQDTESGVPVRRVYEIVDPNADGEWFDRTITPLSLPAVLETGYFRALVAEPSVGSEDRSFLLMNSGGGENRVYRISDLNGDVDALDTGELELLYTGRPYPDAEPKLAPRIVVRDGRVLERELLVTGFKTATRVARVTESGQLVDIARAFTFVDDVAADSDGNIYVLAYPPEWSPNASRVLYRLEPVPPEGAQAGATASATQPASASQPIPGPATGAPRIAVQRSFREVLLIGLDGQRLGTLVSGVNSAGAYQSPGGSHMVYWSDAEIPNEGATYIAKADGSDARKIASAGLDPICWLSDSSVLLSESSLDGAQTTLFVSDADSGERRTVVKDEPLVLVGRCSRDGRYVPIVTGVDYTKNPPAGAASLELLDLQTGDRRRVDGPWDDQGYDSAELSPDGQRLVYTVGPARWKLSSNAGAEVEVHIRDLEIGADRLVFRFESSQGGFAYSSGWSPASDRVVVSVSQEVPCGEAGAPQGEDVCQSWQVLLVDARSGETRALAHDLPHFTYASWAPSSGELAFTTTKGTYVMSADGEVRELAGTAGLHVFDWSPDGRYLGFVEDGPPEARVAVLDTTTGDVRTLLEENGKDAYFQASWWR
jgi:hypothetical protein